MSAHAEGAAQPSVLAAGARDARRRTACADLPPRAAIHPDRVEVLARREAQAGGTARAPRWGMSTPTPTIQQFMTSSPHSIGVDQSLTKARAVMSEHGIRHLPVLHGGKLVGIVTERDLRLVESLAGVDPTKVKVEDAMSTFVYSISPDTPLEEVVATMGEHKYGSAVVMQNAKVVGIFTTVDVCRALAGLLRAGVGS